MKKNIGNTDKLSRLALAGIIVVLYFANVISGVLAIILLILAAVFIITAFLRFCPLYYPFGFSTRINQNHDLKIKHHAQHD
ncbi:MAG TPA: DUF2892 domain-containing protein [Sphingobacteriaceae bacterium]